jgi:hypothetical protein
MSIVVKNVGAVAFTAQGNKNTKGGAGSNAAMGDQGTVRVVLRGVDYVWGPNDSKTLPDDVAAEAVAADSRLRIGDTRDGFNATART